MRSSTAHPFFFRARSWGSAARATWITAALSVVVATVAVPAAHRAPFMAQRFAAAADNQDASRAAAEVMRAGGNAADGAVAAALALGVVSPASSGFGGGGFATICSPRGECTFIDFRETAPAALTAQAILSARDPAEASRVGGLAVGVPGEPAGLLEISRRFGRAGLVRAALPAIALARRGFTVSEHVARAVGTERALLARDPLLARIFLPGGSPVAAGDRVRRPLLARTLENYARGGRAFIEGPFAASIARAVRAHGGVLTEADVRAYRPVERVPLSRAFNGLTVVTAPPPSAGGVIMLETLAWVEASSPPLLRHGSSLYDHLLAEAWRFGFDDRARYVGDPGAGPSMADALLEPSRTARRRAGFDPARVRNVVVIEPARDHGTTHVCVVDVNGMVVSLTTTVNLAFGARIAVPDMDVVLNDEIDDFSLGTAGNAFGMAEGAANTIAPGRRPVSSMTPTVVLRDGRPVGCVGGSGGPRIPTATTQVLLNLFLHGMDPEAAVSVPRIHHQGQPAVLLVDREVPDEVRVGLRARGYLVEEASSPLAAVQAIMIAERNGVRVIYAASDPRKGGLPAGE